MNVCVHIKKDKTNNCYNSLYCIKNMKKVLKAIKFLEDQLHGIYFVDAYFISNYGINMKFILNVNKLDLSKNQPDYFIFYNKKGNFLMDYNKKTNVFWLSYSKIWSKLKEDFGLNDQEIKELTKGMLEKYFKCRVATTWYRGIPVKK